jgi:hypothetical protein
LQSAQIAPLPKSCTSIRLARSSISQKKAKRGKHDFPFSA